MTNIQEEIWKPIPNYEGLYEVSNFGRIKGLPYKNRPEFYPKIHHNHKGYPVVNLGRAKQKIKIVHRLVAICFVPVNDFSLQVNHINGIKTDNRSDNLEWLTCSDNIKHAYKIGIKTGRGESNNFSKFKNIDVLNIRERRAKGEKLKSIAIDYNVSIVCISSISNRRTWTHI